MRPQKRKPIMMISKRTARRRFVRKICVQWMRYFRVTLDMGIKFEDEPPKDEGDHMPQYLREEEKVVTQLERAIIGEEAWAKMIKYRDHHAPGTMAMADVDSSHYGRFTLSFYDTLMNIEDDDIFSLFATSVALHEMLHVVQSPLALYAETLETK